MPACSTVVATAAWAVDAGAQQLVGAEPQQVQQHRVDAVCRSFGGPAMIASSRPRVRQAP